MRGEKKSKLTAGWRSDRSNNIRSIVLLNLVIIVYSASGIFSKTAAEKPFFSLAFFFFYGMMLLLLAVYAFFWQQVIKRVSLSLAYANKALSVAWGIFFGAVFFKERPTPGKLIGAAIVVVGVVLYSVVNEDSHNE